MVTRFETIEDLLEFASNNLPKHVGLIPDGNRRWATKRNMNTNMGHYTGYETVKKILYKLFDAGVKYLSIYALSLENAMKRSEEELKYIYKILKLAVDTVKKEKIVTEEKIRFNVIGRLDLLPQDVRDKINELIEYTKDYDGAFVNVLIMYDGQAEIIDAIKGIIKEKTDPMKIDKKLIKKYLYTHDFPEVDYIIRTGMADGARISGFLLWDSSYAEFKFRNEYWPDYDEKMLIEDLYDYVERNRRHGK
ncbi:MAG: di-trans,poly-cis-decaprenylcistransferase [Candidatus Lokiarchaeota archaeon]|nr:di-trans,poly-cis-decaprenylcistransferase [Candidatus Lokiarchaeota archaeon]MBD3342926.1 di-trans,poly-cis-decaprenylcistransferase [Candidatus Lokiarchaeota archaeon]